MYTENELKTKFETTCPLCKTTIRGINLDDLKWSITYKEPFIVCPICKTEIWDVLEEK